MPYFFLAWTFIQYFLSPIIAWSSGGWRGFLLFPDTATQAVLVSIIFVSSVLLGYALAAGVSSRGSYDIYMTNADPQILTSVTSKRQIVIVTFLAVATYALSHILKYGDLSNIIFSSVSRGAGQFDTVGPQEVIARFFTTLSSGLGALAALGLGLRAGVRKNPGVVDLTVITVMCVVLSIGLVSKFSRASGMLMFLAAIAMFVPGKANRRHKFLAFIIISIGVYFSVIGITQRHSQQGIGSFVEHIFWPDWILIYAFFGVDATGDYIAANTNFLDSIAPISAHIHFGAQSANTIIDSIVDLLFALQPLPSAFFDRPVRFGPALAVEMGTWGSSGITTPALAELFYLFGWGFVFVAVIYGWFLRRIETIIVGRSGIVKYMILMLVLGGIVVSGHSGIRAFARPTVLAWLLVLVSGKTYICGNMRVALK